MAICPTPTSAKAPATTSAMVIVINIIFTWPRNGVFEKCPVSQPRLSAKLKTLSKPDCKNKIAKNNEVMSCANGIG